MSRAISHFDSVPSLLYLAYVERQMSIEAVNWLVSMNIAMWRRNSRAISKYLTCNRNANVL